MDQTTFRQYRTYYKCCKCNGSFTMPNYVEYNFCPMCGRHVARSLESKDIFGIRGYVLKYSTPYDGSIITSRTTVENISGIDFKLMSVPVCLYEPFVLECGIINTVGKATFYINDTGIIATFLPNKDKNNKPLLTKEYIENNGLRIGCELKNSLIENGIIVDCTIDRVIISKNAPFEIGYF